MIKTLDYCTVVNSKKMKGSGLEVGEEVYVISLQQAQEKRNDPYLNRIYTVVVKIGENGEMLLPNNQDEDDNGHRAYLVDPRNLEKVSDERREELEELTKAFYEASN